MPDQNWDDLRFILAVARARSLAGAARLLKVNETTVARRVEKAERRLGVRLFERLAGAYAATAAGVAVIAGAEQIELTMQSLADSVSGRDTLAAGTVRVTSVPLITNRLLAPALPGLLKSHPDLRIELIAEPRDLSLTRRETDIALRLARPTREARAVARRVGDLSYAAYAPRRAKPNQLPWLGYVDAMADVAPARWTAELARLDSDRPPMALAHDAETLLQGIKAGLGKGLLPVVVGANEPGLARVDSPPSQMSRELWLMVHPDLRDLVRIRVVADWLDNLAAGLSA